MQSLKLYKIALGKFQSKTIPAEIPKNILQMSPMLGVRVGSAESCSGGVGVGSVLSC